MKKFNRIFIPMISLVLSACSAQDATEKRIDGILSRLTLEEKVGQMVQINSDVIAGLDGVLTEKGREVLLTYKVGSILNTIGGGGAADPESYRFFIRQIQDLSLEATGIPCIYGLDQIHGATYTKGAVFFPQEVNIAATFDRRHAFNMGEVIAYETRACNVPWVFSPVMDLGRNAIWPRAWESFGEDTYVNETMALAEQRGMQGENPSSIDEYHVGVSLKHFMAYGVPVSGQDRTPSSVSDREMMELYFQPFRACCKAGALSIMVNSALNDGIPFHCNRKFLTEWVKEGLDWEGFFVTDWADARNMFERDHVAASNKEAVALAVNAGIDMLMEPYSLETCTELVELVNEGVVPMSRIDDAVRRILRAKIRLGLFENPYGEKCEYGNFASAESVQKAYRAAVESEVLLKNEGGILPLAPSAKVLLVGPNADNMRTLNGGWSYSWQGNLASNEELTGQYNTIREALCAKFAEVKCIPTVEYDNPWDWKSESVASSSAAVAAARGADVIIACIGENTYCETPGNISDLNLSANQKKLVRDLAATGKPIVLVLNEGRPRTISDIEPLAAAVVDIMLPGNYGADALAALLCGDENFSGKLPFSYPRHVNRLGTYDYLLCENRATMAGAYNYDAKMDMQWNFGDGLSYTTFEYYNLRCNMNDFRPGDVLRISVDVKNSGERAGKESVLLFSSDLFASVAPQVRRLRAFDKIELQPGETRTVEFELPAERLAFFGHDLKQHLEAGEFRLSVGGLSISVNCIETKVFAQK